MVVLMASATGIAFFVYKRFTWEITTTDVHVKKGIIFVQDVQVPFGRVQAINLSSGIADRVLGLANVRIETAGGAHNRALLIPGIKLAEAEALRAEIYRLRSLGAVPVSNAGSINDTSVNDTSVSSHSSPASAVLVSRAARTNGTPNPPPASSPHGPSSVHTLDTDDYATPALRSLEQVGELRGAFAQSFMEETPVSFEFGLSVRQLFLAAISGNHVWMSLLALLGLLAQVPALLAGFNIDLDLGLVTNQDLHKLDTTVIVTVCVGIFVIVMAWLLLATITIVFKLGGFRVRRRGSRIEVENGLIARQSKGVAVSRIQSIQVRQGFIRRFFGFAEVQLLTVGAQGTQGAQPKGQLVAVGVLVHPLIKLSQVDGLLARLLPEFDQYPCLATAARLPRAALRRVILRFLVWPGLMCAALLGAADALFLAHVPPYLVDPLLIGSWILYALVFLLAGSAAPFWYRHARYAWTDTMLLISQGAISITTCFIPRRKIQWAFSRQNPLQRQAGLATIGAVTAAGVGATVTSLRDLSLTDARAFLQWLRPHGFHAGEQSQDGAVLKARDGRNMPPPLRIDRTRPDS
jgi:putative membrane protein